MTKSLRVITNSEMTTYRRCPREHHYAYGLGYRAVDDAEALRIGTLIHAGLELWWMGYALDDVLTVGVRGAADAYEAAKVRVMLRGYDARWFHERERFVVWGVERQFRAPLVNPVTGAASRTYELGGKLDVLLERGFVEHKTTSSDLGTGSVYWRKLAMNSQVSTYFAGARSLGIDPVVCIYDVLRKPSMRPLKATPPENRKYTKQGHLYAQQRAEDETPDAYELRMAEDIAENPDKYYQRGEVVRLEQEETDYALDIWQLTQTMREAERQGAHVRNTDACERFGGMCPYFDVCSGTAHLDDVTRFTKVQNVHQELAADAAE